MTSSLMPPFASVLMSATPEGGDCAFTRPQTTSVPAAIIAKGIRIGMFMEDETPNTTRGFGTANRTRSTENRRAPRVVDHEEPRAIALAAQDIRGRPFEVDGFCIGA